MMEKALRGKAAWRALLLGGSSGTGKTLAAQRLATYYKVGLSQVDDFRLVLQRVTTSEQLPVIHLFASVETIWQLPPDVLCENLIAVGKAMSRAIEVVVAHHVATSYPIIIEGDGIVPAMAVRDSFAGTPANGQVKAVFLFEPDEKEILANMFERGRGFDRHSTDEQLTQARTSWLYGQWLAKEAEQLGLPVINTRPKRTLVRRIIDALDRS